MIPRLNIRLVTEIVIYALLILLPISKAAVEIFFCVLFGLWFFHFVIKRATPSVWLRPKARGVFIAMLLFVVFNAISIIFSTQPQLSFDGFISKWCEYVLFMVIMADFAYLQPKLLKRCAVSIAFASVLVVFEGISQEMLGKGILRQYPWMMYERMTGPYENPIDLAIYLMGILPIVLSLVFTLTRVKKVLSMVLLAVLAGCLARTESQGVWLATAFGFSGFIMLAKGHRKWPLICGGVLLVGGSVVLALTQGFGRIFTIQVGLQDRWSMWQAALNMIQARPFVGQGVNTFMSNYLTYWVSGEQMPRYAHNCYLQVWAEIGLFGLIALLSVFGLQWGYWRRALKKLVDPADIVLLAGMIAAVVSFWLHAAIDTDLYSLRHAALFWSLSGLTTGWALAVLDPSDKKT